MNKIILCLFILLLLALSTYFYYNPLEKTAEDQIPLNESVITTTSATQKADQPDSQENIRLQHPTEGQKISSPLLVTGKARGNWFFEASFPVILTDWDGKIIAQTAATTSDDWMTEEFVSFSAKLEFEKPPYGERGFLILQKDNPSGLPENDRAYEITVFFD